MNYMPAAWSDPAAGVFFSARRRYGILGGAAACILWFTRGGFHAILMQTCGRSLSSVFSKTTKEGINMNYMICIPSPRLVSREYCERIHNILARMSDQYRVNIVPEPVKMRQGSCPDYYKKDRIYKDIKERDGNGEAYLTSEEENMILSVCRNPEEAELMKSCTYAYRYPTTLVLKSFREDKKK